MRSEDYGIDRIEIDKEPIIKPPKVDPDKQWLPPVEGPEVIPEEWAPPMEEEPETPAVPDPPTDSSKD